MASAGMDSASAIDGATRYLKIRSLNLLNVSIHSSLSKLVSVPSAFNSVAPFDAASR
jgi:hypothetical protein